MHFVTSIAAAVFLLSPCAPLAQALSFEGQTSTTNIGSSTGGSLDAHARLVSRPLGKHVPGNPEIIASNVPGAGGNTAASRILNVAAAAGDPLGSSPPTQWPAR